MNPVLVCWVKGCTWGYYSPLPLTLEALATLVSHLMEHISDLEGKGGDDLSGR